VAGIGKTSNIHKNPAEEKKERAVDSPDKESTL
jgi:hypothetical protein